MTKQELITNLNDPRLDYYAMMHYAVNYVTTDPYKSRLVNYMLGRSQVQLNFSTNDMLRWFIDFTKNDFIETGFFKRHGNHIQALKSIWYQSKLYSLVIDTIRKGKPLPVVTTINEKLEEVKADLTLTDEERDKLIGQLRAQRMRDAKAVKREERLRQEALEKEKAKKEKETKIQIKDDQGKPEVTTKDIKEQPKNPTVNIKGHKREMTNEELQIINDLRKLNTK